MTQHPFLALTAADREEMLATIGVASVDELFRDLPQPVRFGRELDLAKRGPDFVALADESRVSLDYRAHLNSQGSPSDTVAAGYHWRPGTELNQRVVNL